jgi:hypothetical protein
MFCFVFIVSLCHMPLHTVCLFTITVSSSYRDKLSEEINDRLQEQGHVTVAELAKAYNLPPEFLREVVEDALGKVIQGQVDSQDSDVVFTNSFVARTRAVIRGAFSAITVYVHLKGKFHNVAVQFCTPCILVFFRRSDKHSRVHKSAHFQNSIYIFSEIA